MVTTPLGYVVYEGAEFVVIVEPEDVVYDTVESVLDSVAE